MRTDIVITDLTRMYQGNVCIAGYDASGKCIRPVVAVGGIRERWLVADGQPIAYPFAAVSMDVTPFKTNPPHVEDERFDPASLKFLRRVPESKRSAILGWSLFDNLADLFGQPILCNPGHYVLDGQGARSLGTVRPRAIDRVLYAPGDEGAWDYRLRFDDGSACYHLKIVDLTWHYYCDCLRGQGREPVDIATDLTEMLKQRTAFLRIGLSRGWSKYPGRCYLQITGIHTVPDYLEGKTFADLVQY